MKAARREAVRALAALLVIPAGVAAEPFTLAKEGDRYDLVSRDAVLADILAAIDRAEPADLRFFGNHTNRVSVTCRGVTLDQLLNRLDVSYVLIYVPEEDGGYRLDDVRLLGAEFAALDPAGKERIRGIIRNLFSDDIPWNAHKARAALLEMGCDAVPLLEDALYSDDYQGRHLAASLLRQICDGYEPSEKLLEVTLDLLREQGYDAGEYWSLFTPYGAYAYISESTGIYPRVRNRLLFNLQSADRRERLLSALLVAEQGETGFAAQLTRILLPHLADNDLRSDAAICTYALYRLGPSALPWLTPYRTSADRQQAELVNLVMTALETGRIPAFNPVMYAGMTKNPLLEKPWLEPDEWYADKFPDDQGRYEGLDPRRWTAADLYGYRNWEPEIEGETTNPEPDPEPDADYVEEPFPYTVREGDTLTDIARRFATTTDAIRRINPGIPLDPVSPGVTLKIPWQ